MSDNESRGNDRVLDEKIAAYVYETAHGAEGVYGMGLNHSAAALTKNLLGQDKKTRGVRVTYEEEVGYTIDIYLIVRFGTNIPEIAWNVQKRAFDGLKRVFDVETENINIHVQGVHVD